MKHRILKNVKVGLCCLHHNRSLGTSEFKTATLLCHRFKPQTTLKKYVYHPSFSVIHKVGNVIFVLLRSEGNLTCYTKTFFFSPMTVVIRQVLIEGSLT